MVRTYVNGDYTIAQEEAGIDHGLLWVMRRLGNVMMQRPAAVQDQREYDKWKDY